jgi:beta-lactamase class A
MRSLCVFLAAVSSSLLYPLALPAATDPSLVRLQQQVEFVSKATDAVVGVGAIHIESNRSLSVRGGEGFPMASAFKLPVAVQIMSLVDNGKLTLDKMVSLTPQDLHPGSGTLNELFFHPGVSLSVANLMELMLVISDNSAADIVLREAGGPAAVTAHLHEMGFTGIRIDRSTAQLISDWSGVKTLPPESEWRRDTWNRLFNAVPQAEHMQARREEMKDPRDTATPDDMTRLLVRLWSGDLLSPQSTKFLLDMLARCDTGKARIKGMLPQGTVVAHKTGTLGGVVDDTGIITLPGDGGHIAISVFTKSSNRPEATSERAIAEVARTIYDYFAAH